MPEDEYRLQLRLNLPSSARAADTAPWITLACNVADVLYSKQKLVPDVAISKAVRPCSFLPGPLNVLLC